jgi:hypothetical protein
MLNYNGKRYLYPALDSVFKNGYPNFEVIFVDNASHDGSVEFIRKAFGHKPNLKIVENAKNYGYAQGNNLGLKYVNALSKYVVFLNMDVQVSKRWLHELVRVMETNPTVGAAQSKVLLLNEKDRIDSCGHFLDPLGYTYQRGEDERDCGQYENITYISYPYGASFIIRKSILSSIIIEGEFFDSSYFCYHEDSDVGWRLRLAGFQVVYVPSSVVYHAKGGTGFRYDIKAKKGPSNIVFHLTKNRITTLIKNYSFTNLCKYLPILLCLEVSRAIIVLPFSMNHSIATFRAIFYVFRNLHKILRKRQIIQTRMRRVSDNQVMQFMVKPNVMYNVKKFRKYSHLAKKK